MYIDKIDVVLFLFFFFQAEDGIRDGRVTGVQTCALPIYPAARHARADAAALRAGAPAPRADRAEQEVPRLRRRADAQRQDPEVSRQGALGSGGGQRGRRRCAGRGDSGGTGWHAGGARTEPNTEKELSAPLTRSAAVAAEQLQELLLVEHRHTELLGPCELRTRLAPGDDVAGLLRHARGHLGAARGERLLGLLAGHAGERAGDDEGAPGERAGAAGRGLQIRPRHTFIA